MADIPNMTLLSISDGKNGKNIMIFDLVPKDEDFPCNEILLVGY